MPVIIRNLGDLKNTRNLDGEDVHRQEALFLASNQQWHRCLNTDTHFLYKSRRIGSSVLCTCGGAGVVVGYHAYHRYSSFIGNEH